MSNNNDTNSDHIEVLVNQHNLHCCVQCGKCVAVCPMGQIFDDFCYEVSPRGIIELATLNYGTPESDHLWYCLTCDLCTDMCPMGVNIRDFVESMRRLALDRGDREHAFFCRSCNVYLSPAHTLEYLLQVLGNSAEEYLTQCNKCRKESFGKKVKGIRPGLLKAAIYNIPRGEIP